ncbi:MAG: hypothetical protein HQL31_02430 [Planctomycetes bacterium]|nr:hypothetical protein [Planctomycetota bacterium]
MGQQLVSLLIFGWSEGVHVVCRQPKSGEIKRREIPDASLRDRRDWAEQGARAAAMHASGKSDEGVVPMKQPKTGTPIRNLGILNEDTVGGNSQ